MPLRAKANMNQAQIFRLFKIQNPEHSWALTRIKAPALEHAKEKSSLQFGAICKKCSRIILLKVSNKKAEPSKLQEALTITDERKFCLPEGSNEKTIHEILT